VRLGLGMFERDAVLARIELALEHARTGEGGSLFIIGEAGLGKTTLLSRARVAAGTGFEIGSGRGQALESVLPFGLVSEAVRKLGGPDPMEAFADARVAGIDARATYFYATLRSLEQAGRPRLLLLDDLQWADADSLALLSFLCRRISELPVAVIATARAWPGAGAELARHLTQQGYAGLEELDALSEPAARALLEQATGHSLDDDTFRRAWLTCRGNPLLLNEVARAIREGRGLPRPGEQAGPTDPGAPDPAPVLAQLVEGIDLRYAHAASLFGLQFRPALAAELSGCGEREAADALEALVKAGLVRSGGTGWAQFVHPLFRQFLYEDIPRPVRERLHGAAFRSLAAMGADTEEAAEQAALGQLTGDAQAIAVLQRSARNAMKAGALARARERMQQAVTLAGDDPSPQLLLGLADTLVSSGESHKAVEYYRRVLASTALMDATRARTHRLLGRALFVTGEVAAAEAEFAAAVTSAGDDLEEAVEALTDHATACWISGGPRRALGLAAEARRLSVSVRTDVRLRAESTWALAAFLCGDPAGIEAAAAAARQAEANPELDQFDPTWGWGSLGTYMLIAKFADDYAEMERVFDVAYKRAEMLGAPLALGVLSTLEADSLARKGRLAEALVCAERATAMVEVVPWLASYAWIAEAGVLELMGRHEECAAWCEKIATLPQTFILRLWLLRITAMLRIRKGRLEEASDLFLECQRTAEAAGLAEPCVVPWARDAIVTHLGCDRVAEAEGVLTWLEKSSARLPCRWPKIVLLAGRAALAERDGRFEEAESIYLQLLDAQKRLGQPLSEARPQIDYGVFLGRRGRKLEARPYLRQALQAARQAGAGWLAEQAQEELEAVGGRAHRRRGLDELTPMEARVARLAAKGLTVREIARMLHLSPRTPESHLQKVYRKFDVAGQRELMRRWAELEKFSTSADDGEPSPN
jgi:DNA-binding CsgD family transcriptional regulator